MAWERNILRKIRGPTHEKGYCRIKMNQEICNKLISPDNVTVLKHVDWNSLEVCEKGW